MAAFTAAQYDRGDRCGGRGLRTSARFSGRVAPVVRARTPEISAVLVATPLRDLELSVLLLLPACLSVPCWLSGADPEWLRNVCAGC